MARQCAAVVTTLQQTSERVAVLQIAQSWMKLADHAGEREAIAENSQQLFRDTDAAIAPRIPKISR
jgi:hypothetical protein